MLLKHFTISVRFSSQWITLNPANSNRTTHRKTASQLTCCLNASLGLPAPDNTHRSPALVNTHSYGCINDNRSPAPDNTHRSPTPGNTHSLDVLMTTGRQHPATPMAMDALMTTGRQHPTTLTSKDTLMTRSPAPCNTHSYGWLNENRSPAPDNTHI